MSDCLWTLMLSYYAGANGRRLADSGNTLELEGSKASIRRARLSEDARRPPQTHGPRKTCGVGRFLLDRKDNKRAAPREQRSPGQRTLHSAERTSRARTHADASLPTRRQQPRLPS